MIYRMDHRVLIDSDSLHVPDFGIDLVAYQAGFVVKIHPSYVAVEEIAHPEPGVVIIMGHPDLWAMSLHLE